MLPPSRTDLQQNTAAFEELPLVKPTGFREYDARWWFGAPSSAKAPEINLIGIQALGLGMGALMSERGVAPKIVVGHDYRAYSLSIKQALIIGLMEAGLEVHDIGLALSPVAYFAQFALGVPGVAMVTASHNENGWTGVKMGVEPPLTFGPDEMGRLKEIVLTGAYKPKPGGALIRVENMSERYLAEVAKVKLSRPIKVVAACGNGTAGAFAPEALRRVGAEVIELDCDLDWRFPNYNANPEDSAMLHAMADAVREHNAELTLGFDGDGDRCGVVDDEGDEIFADKIGLMLARDLSGTHKGATFVVDVKSTGLYAVDPVLKQNGVTVDYWKTGHSYIKRRTTELKALAGFEKSGHFFFREPYGLGYDDGIVSGIAVLAMLDRNPGKKLSDLKKALPVSFTSLTMSPHCDDETKYAVIDQVVKDYKAFAVSGGKILGRSIRDLNTVNGVRVTLEDGSWVLARASSNKPELVVVVESMKSEDDMRALFREEIKPRLGKFPEVGAYNQEI
ncbi:MAG TPA: phosphomannomutase/phosphoglucomutase [Caulobacterales bacterium]|nr:phosphomannomutase/phosphoglucomutase [Caulobacterales bacterium]